MSGEMVPINLPSTSCNGSCSAPNRQNFENRITRVNNNLHKVHEELKGYWSEARRGEITQLKSNLSAAKSQYYACGEEEKKLAKAITELQNQHQLKQREIQELEDTDLIYKDLPHAQQKLQLVEERYNRQKFSNIREEQVQVNEVNRIKRNIAKLGKYIPLVEQRKSLEAQLKSDRQKIRDIRLKMRSSKDKIVESRCKIRATHHPFEKCKEVLVDLKVEKRNLIEQYNDERQAYNAWLKQNKAIKTSSTPGSHLQDQGGDSHELFHNQKTNCRRIMRYLEGLLSANALNVKESDGVGNHSNDQSQQHPYNTDSDSADELPESFKHMNVVRPVVLAKPLSNKSVKKVAKKQAMPLSHGIDYIKMFNDIDVVPPKVIAEVPKVLEEVTNVLDFFEKQTAIPTSEEYYYCTSPIPSLFSGGTSECFESPFTSPQSLSRTESSCSSFSLMNRNGVDEAYHSHSPGSPSAPNSNHHMPK